MRDLVEDGISLEASEEEAACSLARQTDSAKPRRTARPTMVDVLCIGFGGFRVSVCLLARWRDRS